MYKIIPAFYKIILALVLLISIKVTAQSLPPNFYKPMVDFTTGNTPNVIAIGDLDGDGKPDMVVVNINSNTISVLHNTSISGSINASSFAAKVDFAAGSQPYWVGISDIDGDGKLDLVVANSGANTISVLRNTSTTGNINASSFASKVDFVTGSRPLLCSISDLDGDGKPDLVVANFNSNTISILRNTSTSGSINASSFAAKVDFATTTGSSPSSIAISDLDGDGKPDLVITNYTLFTISVFHNTSTLGSIDASSFAAGVDFVTENYPYNTAIGDLDGDGKPDLVVLNSGSNSISVFQNTSTYGSIDASSFATKVNFTVGNHPVGVAIGDLDGDGKPDLVIANQIDNDISVLHNNSTPSTIDATSFSTPTFFNTGGEAISVAIANLNGGLIPEIAVSNYDANTISVFQKAIPLSLTCPQNITSSGCNSTSYNVITSDNCSSTPTLTYKFSGATTGSGNGTGSGSLFSPGITYVTISASDACGNSATCTFTVTVNNSVAVSCTNNNSTLYFGYSGDQSVTVTATPSGGVGPYNVSITIDRPLMCNVVTSIGNESWIGGTGTSSNSNSTCPTSGLPPISAANSIAQGASYSVSATLMADALFTITVTDALGCIATCSTKIHAEDVRCFAGSSKNSKVNVCHNTGSSSNPWVQICVASDAISAFLVNNTLDYLGSCTITNSTAGTLTSSLTPETAQSIFEAKVLPNPSVGQFILQTQSSTMQTIEIAVRDMLGRVIYRTRGSGTNSYMFGQEFVKGVYIVEVIHSAGKQVMKVIKQ
jgi:hypothetical protein